MLPISTELLSLLNEPALVISGGRILYANPAARELLGEECMQKDFRSLFGAEIAGMQAPSFVGETELAGRRMLLHLKTLDSMRVLVLSPSSPVSEQVGDAFLYALRSELMQIGVSLALLRGQPGSTADEGTCAITRSLFRINRTLQNLTVIRGAEKGTLLFRPQPLDLCKLIQELTDSIRVLIAKPEIRLSLPEEAAMSGDPELLEMLLLNLLSNCLYHAEGCSVIHVRLHRAGEQYILSVSDDGCGIPESGMRTVMERYSRAMGPAGAAHGPGLGLTAARAAARLHGGTLMLESREGRGTTVRVSLHRDPTPRTPQLASAPAPERSYDSILTGLAECLPPEVFESPFRES